LDVGGPTAMPVQCGGEAFLAHADRHAIL
jgi:hypothetical protein